MLRNKDITKIQEVGALFKNTWTRPEFFSDHLKLFRFSGASDIFAPAKKSGIPFWALLKVLLVLPFAGRGNVASLFAGTYQLRRYHRYPEAKIKAPYSHLAHPKLLAVHVQ
jgi:hypothetical protein